MDIHVDRDELQYICTTVFPTANSSKILKNPNLIHYQGVEPEFGDRFVQTEFPDYQGNDPYRFFTLNQEKLAKLHEKIDEQIEPQMPGMTLQRNYVLNDNRARRDTAQHEATEALNALDDAIDAAGDDDYKEVVDDHHHHQQPHDATTPVAAEPPQQHRPPVNEQQHRHSIASDRHSVVEHREHHGHVEETAPTETLEELVEQHHYQNLYTENLEPDEQAPKEEAVAERPRAMSRDPVQSHNQIFGTSTVIEKIDGEVVAQIDFPTAMPMHFYSPELHLATDDFQPHITVDGEPVAAARSGSTLSSKRAAINREVLEVTNRRATPPNSPSAE